MVNDADGDVGLYNNDVLRYVAHRSLDHNITKLSTSTRRRRVSSACEDAVTGGVQRRPVPEPIFAR